MCPVVGSWPGKDFTTKAAGILETELTAAGIPYGLKVYLVAERAFFNNQRCAYHPAAASAVVRSRPQRWAWPDSPP